MTSPTAPSSPSHGISRLKAATLCFSLALLMHLPWLGITHLAGTEGHRVLAARGMIQNHWWLVSTLYGRPFMTKPPLHYWIIAWSQMLAGESLFVWRVPSAIAGALLCAIVSLFGSRWFGRTAGLIAGLCAVGMIALWGQCQTADIDATNTFFSALAALGGIEMLFGGEGGGRGKARRDEGTEGRRGREKARSPEGTEAPSAGEEARQDEGTEPVSTVTPPSLRASVPSSLCPPAHSPLLWILGTGLALAGMLMTKGPGGLPIIAGVWLTAVIAAWLERRMGDLASPRFWLPVVIGLALFGAYSFAAKRSLMLHHMQLDNRGLEEGLHRLYPTSFRQLGQSLFVMLPQVILFAMPMSAALLFLRDPDVRVMLPGRQVRMALALAASVLVSWFVCVASGMVNPRYAYVTYAPLCPLAGAMAVAAARSRRADFVQVAIVGTAVALAGATAGLAWACRKGPLVASMLMYVTALLAVATAFWIIRKFTGSAKSSSDVATSASVRSEPAAPLAYAGAQTPSGRTAISWNAAWGLVVLMMLASVPFGMQRHLAREKDSGIGVAQLVQNVTGPNATVAAGETILWRPEIFYYTTGVEPEFHPYTCWPEVVKPGRWVMLDAGERRNKDHGWVNRPGVVLEKEQLLYHGPNGIDYYLAWYAAYTPAH